MFFLSVALDFLWFFRLLYSTTRVWVLYYKGLGIIQRKWKPSKVFHLERETHQFCLPFRPSVFSLTNENYNRGIKENQKIILLCMQMTFCCLAQIQKVYT